MPYSVGEKGSYGCSGYPAVKDDGTVMGCHKTAEEAANQIYAINVSEGNIEAGVGIKNPEESPIRKALPDAYGPASADGVPAGRNCANCMFYDTSKVLDGKAYCTKWDDYVRADYYCKAWEAAAEMEKADIKEGDYVMGMTVEGMVTGQVEHVMTEGGIYGVPGTEYAVQSTPENPAMAVRVFEEEDGMYYPTAYSIGMRMMDAQKIPKLPIGQDEDEEDMEELERLAKASPCWEGYTQRGMKPGQNGGMVPNCVPVQKYHEALMRKAETYSPTEGMKAAARRALKWKAEGKATGAGTPVGWGRATDIVAGRPMSLSTVKRMYSFFSRHEVDKKGKDFYNTANPSNGRIMWDAWGGDAGFSWSRGIAERMRDKALFANFGKDYTKSQPVDLFKAKSVSVGDHVTFAVPKDPQPTEYAHGEVERVERSGTVTVGNEKIEASSANPVAVVRVWAVREGGGYAKTDRRVPKSFSSLRVMDSELKESSYYEDEEMKKVSTSRLQELADNYNKNKEGNKRITVGALRQVYNRGIGAYRTNPGSVRPNVTSAEQWAMGRVNAFMAGLRGRFPRKPFDLDLFPKGHPRATDKKPEGNKMDSDIWSGSAFGI